MNLKLHANATTTPKIRADIQASSAPVSQLARGLAGDRLSGWSLHSPMAVSTGPSASAEGDD